MNNHQPDHVTYNALPPTQNKTIHPDYYKDRGNGSQDLAYHENAMFPRDWVIGNCVITAIKYLKRFPYKNGIDDVKKCRTYIDRLIDILSKGKD